MPVKFRSAGGGGGGGSDTPDIVADDDAGLEDTPGALLRQPDDVAVADANGPMALGTDDNFGLSDPAILSLGLALPDDLGVDETGSLVATFGPTEDSYISENNGTSNFGSSTTLSTSSGIIFVQDQTRAIFAWDFTDMTAWQQVSGDASIDFTAYYQTPVVEILFSMGIYAEVSASKPWEEDTITWNTYTEIAEQEAQIDFPLLAGAGDRTVTFDDLTVDDLMGNWLAVETRMVGLVELGVFSIRSKEHATVATRPRLTISAELA